MIVPKVNMPEAEKQIIQDVKYFNDRYFVYDEPIPFVGHLMLYPVTVRNYSEFLSCSSCLTLNKNDELAGIRTSHLGYLLSKMENKEEGQAWCYRFTKILELCLHVPSGLKCPKCGKFMSFQDYAEKIQAAQSEGRPMESILNCECGVRFQETIGYKKDEKTNKPVLVIDGVDIDPVNYNRMRKYIMYQNLPDFKDDSYVDPEVREDQRKAHELKSRGQPSASLERQIICVAAKSSYKIEEVYDLSIRKFTMLLGVINDAIEYEASKIGLMTGMVSLKKGETIDHWIYKKETGMYDAAKDSESYTSQIRNA